MSLSSGISNKTLKLNILKKYLEKLDFETLLIKESKDIPYDALFSVIKQDYENKNSVSISFNYIPIPNDFIETLDFLQFITFLDCNIVSDYKSNVTKLLNILNFKLTIGSFFVTDNNKVTFKYVLMTSSSKSINEDNIKEAIMIYVYMYNLFSHIIVAVANGEKSLSTAIKEIS